MLVMDQLPKEKPASNFAAAKEGKQLATISKAEYIIGKTDEETKQKKQDFLRVSFKLTGGGYAQDNFFDNDKPFNMYKVGRLVNACGLKLKGEITLKDLAKLIINKDVIVDVVINDRGYGELDYSKDNEGIYPVDEASKVETSEDDTAEDKEVQAEIDAVYADEEF